MSNILCSVPESAIQVPSRGTAPVLRVAAGSGIQYSCCLQSGLDLIIFGLGSLRLSGPVHRPGCCDHGSDVVFPSQEIQQLLRPESRRTLPTGIHAAYFPVHTGAASVGRCRPQRRQLVGEERAVSRGHRGAGHPIRCRPIL